MWEEREILRNSRAYRTLSYRYRPFSVDPSRGWTFTVQNSSTVNVLARKQSRERPVLHIMDSFSRLGEF